MGTKKIGELPPLDNIIIESEEKLFAVEDFDRGIICSISLKTILKGISVEILKKELREYFVNYGVFQYCKFNPSGGIEAILIENIVDEYLNQKG